MTSWPYLIRNFKLKVDFLSFIMKIYIIIYIYIIHIVHRNKTKRHYCLDWSRFFSNRWHYQNKCRDIYQNKRSYRNKLDIYILIICKTTVNVYVIFMLWKKGFAMVIIQNFYIDADNIIRCTF
jgi:hypothetical protein